MCFMFYNALAITFLEKRKKQRYLILVFALVIIVALLVFWFGFLTKLEQLFSSPETAVPSRKKIEISWDVLRDSRLESLEKFEEISPLQQEGGGAGRENPFEPF